jgi:polysaccharide chain length determinant protein (PEP-CTERM system associated)
MANGAVRPMDRLILDLLRHVRAMWRYRWAGLIIAWSVAVVGAVIVFVMPRHYEASARVFVNNDSILKPLMTGVAVESDFNQRVAVLSRLLVSRTNIEKLIKATGLDEKKANSKEQWEKLVGDVTRQVHVVGSGEHDNMYLIKFQDKKPERAKAAVEFLVNLLINSTQGGRASDTQAAKKFLDEQAMEYEQKLRDAENRLKEFKLRNMVESAQAPGQDYFAQAASVADQLRQAQLQLREAENSREAFRRGLSNEDMAAAPATGLTSAGETIADIDTRLGAMKRNLDGLLQRFTEDHPDVVGARRVIAELEAKRKQLLAQYRDAGIPLTQVATSGPRASEELKVSLAQAEANVASLRARVADFSERYNQLRQLSKRMPEIEAELAQLNRDYEINKKNYESLISRRESASIAENMQSVAGMGDFQLVDPPRTPSRPVSPQRSLLILMTLLAALGAAGGSMFFAKEVRSRFFDLGELREFSGLPTLGVVSLVVSDQMRLEGRRRNQRFMAMAGGLFGVYALVVVSGWWLTRLAT